MSTPLEFSMKKPNTQRQESTTRARERRCQLGQVLLFQIDPQYEKLKVESGLGWSFVLSQVLLTQIGSSQIPPHKTMFSNRKPAINQQFVQMNMA